MKYGATAHEHRNERGASGAHQRGASGAHQRGASGAHQRPGGDTLRDASPGGTIRVAAPPEPRPPIAPPARLAALALAALTGGASFAGASGCTEPDEADVPFEAPLEKPAPEGEAPPAGAPEEPPHTAAPSFDFTLPADSFVVQGATVTHEVPISSIEGFTGAVTMTATSVYPLGLSLTPASVNAPGRTALSISAPCNWPAVPREVLVTGASGTVSKPKSLLVRVFPFGSFLASRASVHVPRAIPDNSPNGATSTLLFSEEQTILHLIVEPRVTHPRPSDLVVELIPPSGAATMLHNHAAALQPSYTVFAYNTGRSLAGDWRLRVVDTVTGSTGTIAGWTMRSMVRGLPPPPAASFGVLVDELQVDFTDTSTDPLACGGAGELASWSWDFGDGSTSTARHPRHVYAAPGLYDVTLTVTNGSDMAAQAAQRVAVTQAAQPAAVAPAP